MLQKIVIKNLAIIDSAEIHFSNSLNIITGETGSGKSLIVNAIDLLMGAKFNKEIFRDNNDIQLIGNFVFNDKNIEIKRVFRHSGGHKVFINNNPSTSHELKKITKNYIDMHSQYNQHSIFDKSVHIDYLDKFGDYSDLLDSMRNVFIDYERNRKDLIELKKEKDDIISKRELYEYQLVELNGVELYDGVDYEISQNYDKLSNTEKVRSTIDSIVDLLENDNDSLKINLFKLIKMVNELSNIDKEFNSFIEIFENININIEELRYDFNSKKDEYVFDENKFNNLADNLEKVQMIKRKYGGTIQSAISYKSKIEEYLNDFSNIDEQIEKLDQSLKQNRKKIEELADKISNKRIDNIPVFERNINKILCQLNMEDAIFAINLIKTDLIHEKGQDHCEFYIRTNKGSKIKPVIKIASGGEISRIMLAIKILMQNKVKKNTLIFDEIDLGVSGKAAENLGENLLKLSKETQVICISHLPQVASKGNRHYKVLKKTNKDLTFSKIIKLNSKTRIDEIAQMLSGKKITNSSVDQAKYLLGTC